MKLILSLLFSLINSVMFLLYLNSTRDFLPLNEGSSYDWTNIVTVVVLCCVVIFSFLGILITLGQLPFKKKIAGTSLYFSVKYAGISTLFLLALGVLYFFHILTWYWVSCMCVLLGILILII